MQEYSKLKPEIDQIILNEYNINRNNTNKLNELIYKTFDIINEFESTVNKKKMNNENFDENVKELQNDIKDLRQYNYKLNDLLKESQKNGNMNKEFNINNEHLNEKKTFVEELGSTFYNKSNFLNYYSNIPKNYEYYNKSNVSLINNYLTANKVSGYLLNDSKNSRNKNKSQEKNLNFTNKNEKRWQNRKKKSEYKDIINYNSFNLLDFGGESKNKGIPINNSINGKEDSFGNKIFECEPNDITKYSCLPFYKILNNCSPRQYDWELIPKEIASNQLEQGEEVGNCYMVSALESISHIPFLLTYIFEQKFSAKQEKFKVTFKQKNGKSEFYFILNNFPVN